MKKVIKQLQAAGLNEKEALVYYAGLSLGVTTILNLARETNLKRATVYSLVDSLVRQGLMRRVEVGLKMKVETEDPKFLESVMERKNQDVSEAISGLEELYKKRGRTRSIRVYEGEYAVRNLQTLLMDMTRSGDYRYFIGGNVGWKEVDPKMQEKYFKWRERIKLDVRLLFQDSLRAEQHRKISSLLRHVVKTLPKDVGIKSDIIITPRLLILQKLTTPVSAVVIEDEDIIETYKNLFLFIWGMV